MPRKILAMFVVTVCSLALALGGQSYPTEKKKSEDKKGAGAAEAKTVSLTGCLKAGKNAKNFTLTNVSGETVNYRLIGKGDVDLKKHAGHRVEVTGMLVPRGKGKDKAKLSATSLNVTSLKHLATTCP